jgi:hypothetical protein
VGQVIAQVSWCRRSSSVVFDRVASKYDGNTGRHSLKGFTTFDSQLEAYGVSARSVDPSPARYELKDNEHSNYKIGKDALDTAKERKVNVLLVLLPDKGAELYFMAKQLGDQVVGMHTICNVVESGPKVNDQFLGNIGFKFNLKSSNTAANQILAPNLERTHIEQFNKRHGDGH